MASSDGCTKVLFFSGDHYCSPQYVTLKVALKEQPYWTALKVYHIESLKY